MIKDLQNIFNKITLKDIDSLNDIVDSKIFLDFNSYYPNLKEVLAFGSFQRATFNQNVEISPNLISFWIFLTEEILKRSQEDTKAPWNVYILGIKNWFSIPSKALIKINIPLIRNLISNAKPEYNKIINEYFLNLDLSQIEEEFAD